MLRLRSSAVTLRAPVVCLAMALFAWLGTVAYPRAEASERADEAARRVLPGLQAALDSLGADIGAPIYLRIFKHESELELWVRPGRGGEFELFKTYPICAWSGRLGPKTREGDRQAPEGVYVIGRSQLNPNSQFHLSFNLGYPNAYERAQGWTGSALMVHGACVSIGCYAMTDPAIEEIYSMVDRSIASGQRLVPVHAFPFRMSAAQRERFREYGHDALWDQLQRIYDQFETRRIPPDVQVDAAGYRVRMSGESGH